MSIPFCGKKNPFSQLDESTLGGKKLCVAQNKITTSLHDTFDRGAKRNNPKKGRNNKNLATKTYTAEI